MKKTLFILFCFVMATFTFSSCKDAGNDYLISYGIGENEQHFSGTPEQVDSLSLLAFRIMDAVENIYRQELSALSSETDTGSVVFRGTNKEDVLTKVNAALKNADQQLDEIEINWLSGLYFEYNVKLMELNGNTVPTEIIYNRKFGEKPIPEE